MNWSFIRIMCGSGCNCYDLLFMNQRWEYHGMSTDFLANEKHRDLIAIESGYTVLIECWFWFGAMIFHTFPLHPGMIVPTEIGRVETASQFLT